MADNAVATREISRTWNELDWAWILKHWRNYSVCDGNLQNCPSLPRRAQLSDRRTLVERLFSVFHPEGNFHGEVLRISKKRSWHTLHQLSRSDRFYKITTYRLSEVENITRNFRIFFFFFFDQWIRYILCWTRYRLKNRNTLAGILSIREQMLEMIWTRE